MEMEIEEEEKPKLEPIWQNLPLHFKKDVVGKLDYRERCSLRKCSISDQTTVDSSPINLHDVAIHISADYTIFSFSNDGNTIFIVKYFKNSEKNEMRVEVVESPRIFVPGKNLKIISKKSRILENVEDDDMDFAIQDFLMTIQKLKVNRIVINDVIIPDYHPEADGKRVSEFRRRILEAHPQRKIEAQGLKLKWHSDSDEVLQMLSLFQPGTLKKIEFSDRKATWQMRSVAASEHWRRAEEIYLEVMTDLELVDLVHAHQIQAHVSDLEPEKVWRVIKAFLQKPIPGASFHFSYQSGSPDLNGILAKFDVAPQNLPIQAQTQLRTVLARRFLFTQRFPMADRRLVLVFMIAEKEVLGTVCHVESVNSEAKVERGLLR